MDGFFIILNDTWDGRLRAMLKVVATKVGHRFLQESMWEFINMFLETTINLKEIFTEGCMDWILHVVSVLHIALLMGTQKLPALIIIGLDIGLQINPVT